MKIDKPHINMRHGAYNYATIKRSFRAQREDVKRLPSKVKRACSK